MNHNTKKHMIDIIEIHKKMLSQLESHGIESIASAADMITNSLNQGGCVYICGNGGSAADAQHIAAELVGRLLRERKALRAVALSTDTSILTSIANDYSFEQIFQRQVQALVKKGDILWAISTSGNSSNVVAAAKLAKKLDAKVLAFTGKSDCQLAKIADVCFCAEDSASCRVQEIHQIAYHIICDLVELQFCQ